MEVKLTERVHQLLLKIEDFYSYKVNECEERVINLSYTRRESLVSTQ